MIEPQKNVNGAMAIDNARFEATPAPVPEPSAIALMALALAGLGAARRRPHTR